MVVGFARLWGILLMCTSRPQAARALGLDVFVSSGLFFAKIVRISLSAT